MEATLLTTNTNIATRYAIGGQVTGRITQDGIEIVTTRDEITTATKKILMQGGKRRV